MAHDLWKPKAPSPPPTKPAAIIKPVGGMKLSAADVIVVLCVVPADFDSAKLARTLVERSLAACVQSGPEVTSTYRWKGVVETSAEKLVLIKTRSALFGAVERAIRKVHPYDVPEIIALPVVAGHAPYLGWVSAETTSRPGSPEE